MLKKILRLVLWFWLIGFPSIAFAQKATEIYIPLGKSPGLSGVHTALGTIDAVNAQDRNVTMASASGERYTVRLSDDTKIWLDRSKIGERNVVGSFSDLQQGRRIEVRFSGEDRTGTVVWIKVEITASG